MPEPLPAGAGGRVGAASRSSDSAATSRALLEVAVTVSAGLVRTFDAATDWASQGRWIPLTRVTVVAGDGQQVGSVIHAFTGVGRVGFLDVMRITAWDAPHRVDVLHVGRLLKGPATFRFTAVPGTEPEGETRTRFTWSEEFDVPLGAFGRAAWPLVKPLAAALLWGALRRFSRHVARTVLV
jgi:hypothetical protein